MECFEDGGGGRFASAEFAGEVEGVGDSEAGEIGGGKQGSKEAGKLQKRSRKRHRERKALRSVFLPNASALG